MWTARLTDLAKRYYTKENKALIEKHFELVEGNATVVFCTVHDCIDGSVPIVVTPSSETKHIKNVGVVIGLAPDDIKHVKATVEHTIGLIHAIHRRIPLAQREVIEQAFWNRYQLGAPWELEKKTLGVIGLGRIGGGVARAMAAAHHMKIQYFDKRPLYPNFRRRYVLADLVASSHVIIHTASGGMFGGCVLERLDPDKKTIFVCTSRAQYVDYGDVFTALEDGRLRGAAFDVMPNDLRWSPRVQRLALKGKLIVTPHIGGSTEESWAETQRVVINKAIRALVGHEEEWQACTRQS